jgi:hypothetical protein
MFSFTRPLSGGRGFKRQQLNHYIMLTSKMGEPIAAFFLPMTDKISDLTTTGYGIVHVPTFLETTDFSDAGEDLADVSGKTFTGTEGNYFVGQCIRLGGNDGADYVVTAVTGDGSNTVTVDKDISESNGADIFISQYYSIQRRTDNFNDGIYKSRLYIYLLLGNGYTTGQVDVIFANGDEITDFYLNDDSNLELIPFKKIVRNDNNVLAGIYATQAF